MVSEEKDCYYFCLEIGKKKKSLNIHKQDKIYKCKKFNQHFAT